MGVSEAADSDCLRGAWKGVLMNPIPVEALQTRRLFLEPLRIAHANEMVAVLADPVLYEFTGGEPPAVDVLVARYRAQVAGAGRDGEQWLNWVARRRDTGKAMGFVQATVCDDASDIAWLIGVGHQGLGFAVEAVSAMIAELAHRGVRDSLAHIHPDHIASHRVAASVGLARTGEVDDDGEELWARSTNSS